MKWVKKNLKIYLLCVCMIGIGIIVSVSNTNSVCAQSIIPADAYDWNGHSYMLYTNPMTIFKAKLYCESLGGHLLEIQTAEEMEAIRRYRSQKNVGDVQLWLGAIKYVEGDWKWMSGETGEKKIYVGDGVTSYEVNGKRFSSTDKKVYPQYSSWKSYYAYIESVNLSQVTHGFICEWDTEVKKKISISEATVSLSSSTYTYDGNAKKPTATVTLNGKKLKKGTDYTVSYMNNVEIGTSAQVLIKGKGKYTGSALKLFKIIPKTPSIFLSSSNCGEIVAKSSKIANVTGYEFLYYKSKSTQKKTVISLKENITISGLTADAIYYVKVRAYKTVDGKNVYSKYSSSKSQKVYKGKSISNATVAFKIPNVLCIYNGKAQKPEIQVKLKSGVITTVLKNGKDYSALYSNNVNAGTATIMITGKGKYYGTVKKNFVIGKAVLSSSSVKLSSTSYTYTANAIKPGVLVTGVTTTGAKIPITSSDYTVSYKNNIDAGKASVIVKGKGNFTGTVEKKFTINPRSLDDCEISLPNGYTYTLNGAEVRPEVKLTYKGILINYDPSSTYDLTYHNNKSSGKAYVLIEGKRNFTGKKKLEFDIVKFVLTWPMDSSHMRIGTLLYYNEYKNTAGTHLHRANHPIDINGSTGDLVKAAADGRVESTVYNSSYGNYVKIWHDEDGDGMYDDSYTLYAHLSEKLVYSGEVKQGQAIGKVGNTGNSTGDHLHFEWSGGNAWSEHYKYLPLQYDTSVYLANQRESTGKCCSGYVEESKEVVEWLEAHYFKNGKFVGIWQK